MSAEVAKAKWTWLDRIAADPKMRGLPMSVAHCLASTYLNGTLTAWPGTRRLATDLNAERRNVQIAITKLAKAGYLAITRRGSGKGGRGLSNVYMIQSQTASSTTHFRSVTSRNVTETASSATINGVVECTETASPTTPEPFYLNPSKNPIDAALASPSSQGSLACASEEEEATKRARQEEVSEGGFYAEPGSLQLSAWYTYFLQHKGSALPKDMNGGCRVPAEWPPDRQQKAS